MLPNKNYSEMTLEELELEEKGTKSGTIAFAFAIGMLLGVAFWSAISGKFFLTIILFGAALFIGYKNSQTKKAIQAEILRRKSAN